MENLINYILFSVYIALIVGFVFIFYKNEYNLSKSLKFIKIKLGKCCIKNKTALDKVIGSEVRKEIEDSMLKINSCDQPIEGLPLDLCITENLDETDIKLRGEVAEILSNRKNVVFDGGKNKRVVPLEATIFLTKAMNPLVNEEGEILIISETVKKDVGENQHLKKVSMFLKDYEVKNSMGELIYEDSDEIIQLLKKTLLNSNMSKKNIKGVEKEVIPENFSSKVKEYKPAKKEESTEFSLDESHIDMDGFENPFGDEGMEIDFNEGFEVEAEESENEGINRVNFYENRKFKALRGLKKGTRTNALDVLKENLDRDDVKLALLHNLILQKRIVYSSNKEYIFIDMNLFLFSYLKLFGPEFKLMKEIYSFTNKKINDAFKNSFIDNISDIHHGNKNVNKTIIEKDGNKYFSFGICLETKSFRIILSDDEYDFFRAMPYQTGLSLTTGQSKVRFISSLDDCE